jgi:hypothetical protein
VTVSGNYAYVADGLGGLQIIDISDPTASSKVGFYDTPGWASDAVVEENYVHIADGDSGVLTLWSVPSTVVSVPTGGGKLSSSVDNTDYTFPSGAFTSTATITHTARSSSNLPSIAELVDVAHSFEVTAVYSSTGEPAHPTRPYTIAIQYTDAEKGPAIEETLDLYWWDEGADEWSQQGITSTVSVTDNVVTAQVNHFSLFTLLGETNRVYIPLVLRNQ